jgi:hypothetical protein
MWEMRNAYKILVGKTEIKILQYFEDLDMDTKIVLKLILNVFLECSTRVTWLMTETSGGVLWT